MAFGCWLFVLGFEIFFLTYGVFSVTKNQQP